jgi:ABC-type amino acid transport system permease subunit
LHATSLAYFVSLLEVTGTARILAHNNWNYFEAFAASGVIYWVLTVLIELLTVCLEKVVEKHGYSLKIQ